MSASGRTSWRLAQPPEALVVMRHELKAQTLLRRLVPGKLRLKLREVSLTLRQVSQPSPSAASAARSPTPQSNCQHACLSNVMADLGGRAARLSRRWVKRSNAKEHHSEAAAYARVECAHEANPGLLPVRSMSTTKRTEQVAARVWAMIHRGASSSALMKAFRISCVQGPIFTHN